MSKINVLIRLRSLFNCFDKKYFNRKCVPTNTILTRLYNKAYDNTLWPVININTVEYESMSSASH